MPVQSDDIFIRSLLLHPWGTDQCFFLSQPLSYLPYNLSQQRYQRNLSVFILTTQPYGILAGYVWYWIKARLFSTVQNLYFKPFSHITSESLTSKQHSQRALELNIWCINSTVLPWWKDNYLKHSFNNFLAKPKLYYNSNISSKSLSYS